MAPTEAGSVGEALEAAIDALSAAGIESPRLDAELLLAEAGGLDRARIAAEPAAELGAAAGRRFGELVRRRLCREPVAYILRRRGFRHLDLSVDQRVLIPRPETELLVELAVELRPATALDVGTGSGAVALAIADELPECEVTATDRSPLALEVAKQNANRGGLGHRVRFEQGTLPRSGEFDLLVANLPYVAERDWPYLEPEVNHWEPREALLAGRDGLDAIRALLSLPLPTRILALEVGDGQAEAVGRLASLAGFDQVQTRRDLAGIERVVWGRRG